MDLTPIYELKARFDELISLANLEKDPEARRTLIAEARS